MVVIIGMWGGGVPAAAGASMTLQQLEDCHVFSWGNWPWITGPLAVACCTGSRGRGVCVGSDLCLHTGFLVAVAAAVAVPAFLWSPR